MDLCLGVLFDQLINSPFLAVEIITYGGIEGEKRYPFLHL